MRSKLSPDLKFFVKTPPWEWPKSAGRIFRETLKNRRASESDRLLAAELAGETVVINDELAEVLLSIVDDSAEPDKLRAKAAIALGPVLEQTDTDGFDFPEDVLIAEPTFRKIKESLHQLYADTSLPKEVRRRILESSVRAPENWHREAISKAYSSADRDWKLTAVFSMEWIAGFEDQIFEALESSDPDIHYHAVCAAGNWQVDPAWSHIVALVTSSSTEKRLRLAAIEALGNIRPAEARPILVELTNSEDEDIAEAAEEAMIMAEAVPEDEEDQEDEEGETTRWIN